MTLSTIAALTPAAFPIAIAVFVGVGFVACTAVRKVPVKARLHDYPIETTVDDERARYYLERYLRGDRKDPHLDAEIEKVHAKIKDRLPSREESQAISTEFSVDFATLVFGNQLLKQKGNAQLQKQFLRNLENVQSGTIEYPHKDTLVLLVPGYDYAANGHVTGADFAKPRMLIEKAGYDVHFVNIDPIGSVEENATFLAKTILANRHRKIAIAGASSAGPAVHLTLGKLLAPADVRHVRAWLNLGGILQGVPVLDKFSCGPKGWLFSSIIWFKGWRKSSFESMYTPVSRTRFASLAVPKHIAIYNYVGLSLSGNISRFAWDKYLMMRDDGPNDGLTLLPDLIAPNSLSILAPDRDHFFAEDPKIDVKTLALLATVLEPLRTE